MVLGRGIYSAFSLLLVLEDTFSFPSYRDWLHSDSCVLRGRYCESAVVVEYVAGY